MVRLNLEFPSPRGGFLMAVSAVALAAVASPSLAIDVVRSENWDGDWAANWTIEGGVWEVGRPLNTGIGEPTLPAGQNCAATSLNANYPDGADARLVWSLMDIPATNPRLRFSHWMRMQSNDYGYIAIRIEGSDLWTEVSDFCADVGRGDQNSCAIAFDTHDVWVPVSIDLSDYAGERAEVAFVFHSNSAYNDVGWYIDNVQMESGGYDFDLAQGWESGFQGWHAAMGRAALKMDPNMILLRPKNAATLWIIWLWRIERAIRRAQELAISYGFNTSPSGLGVSISR